MVEEIVSGDDDQLERYLSGDVPTAAELERTLAHEVLDRLEFPVLVGSALTGVGIDRLADFICEIGPAPSDRPMVVVAGDEEIEVPADAGAQPLAYVFKTLADQFVGQVSLCKVVSGTISVDDRLIASSSSVEERLHALFHMRGKEQLPCAKAVAGDIVAVAKLTNTSTGTTLAPRNMPVRVVGKDPAPPVFGLALKPLTQTDDDKLSGRFTGCSPRIQASASTATTPTRRCSAVPATPSGRCARALARKFGVHVETEDVRMPYRERWSARAPRAQSRTVRRPRSIRRRQSPRQSARTRCRFRIRRLDRRRGNSAQLHPCRPEGNRRSDDRRRCTRFPRRRRARRVL